MTSRQFASELKELGPICRDNSRQNSHERIPTPMLFSNIPMLWMFLEMVVQDWHRYVEPYQVAVDNADIFSKSFHVASGFLELQPYYLKCLFSYVLFFVALDGAYQTFYDELATLAKKLGLNNSDFVKPQRSPYIQKVRNIRNLSIAHIGSKKAKPIDTAAAMMWQPMSMSPNAEGRIDFSTLTFGDANLISRNKSGETVEQSLDLKVGGIPELDLHCREYLSEYDYNCTNFLKLIHSNLPIQIGDEYYFEFKVNSKN